MAHASWKSPLFMCRLEQSLNFAGASVTSVAFSHDSKLLASASADSTVKIWDAATGCLQQTLENRYWVTSVAFSHDSKLLASAASTIGDSIVKIWDAVTGSLQRTLKGHSDSVESIAFVNP
jgi:WD40 repeat protein